MAEVSHPAFEDASNTPWAVVAMWAGVVAALAVVAAPWLCYAPLMVAFIAALVAVFASLRALGTPTTTGEGRHMAAAGLVLGTSVIALTLIVGLLVGLYVAFVAFAVASA